MRNYSLLIIVGATLFSGVSAAGQDSTIPSRTRPSGQLQPANAVLANSHRVVLRAPMQLVSTARPESNAGEDTRVKDAEAILPAVGAPYSPRVIHVNQRHAENSEPLPVHACVHCAKPKSTPVRRFLDRFASGVDYVVFGVTAAPSRAVKAPQCDCDQLNACDASVEPIWSAADAFQQPVWNHAPKEESKAGDLSDYFDQRPRRETRPAVPESPRNEKGKLGGTAVSPPKLSAPQGYDGSGAIGEISGRSTGRGLTPATKIPPRFPVAPLLDAPEDRPGTPGNGKGNSGADWIPPTNPFEDDPLPRK